MLTTIDQFAGQDIWVYAELEYEDAYIRIEKVFDDGTVIYNAWLPSDSRAKYDIDEILYGELTGDVDSIEIHPLDTITTDELIARFMADGKVTASTKFTKYPQGYVKASTNDIKYYEVMFDTIPRNEEDLDGDVVGEYSICIRGRRRPSLKEAAEFCKKDMDIMSKSYGDLFVVNVAEIDKEDAYTFFDMENEDKYPIFE